jgi:hypothetical protein
MAVIGEQTSLHYTFSQGFESQEYYTEGRTEFWFFQNFISVFASGVGPVLQGGAGTVRYATIISDKKDVSDAEIEAELPVDSGFLISEICLLAAALMDRQRAGEEGALAEDNIFYTSTRLARILRFPHSSRWHLSTWKRGEIAWRKGDRVWFKAL